MKDKKKSFVLWLTGLSAAGKTTIANRLYKELENNGIRYERLDGDIVRANLTKDLGYTKDDRDENIRRVGFVADSLSRNGVNVIASFITPYRRQREELRKKVHNYIEVFVDASLEVCEKRDPKGIYKKARSGEIKFFTGISDPYDRPENPDIHIETHKLSVEESLDKIIKHLKDHNIL